MFPTSFIHIITVAGKFCYPQMLLFIEHTGFWTCATQRRSWRNQKINPPLCLLIWFGALKAKARFNQFSKRCPRRICMFFIVILEFARWVLLKAQGSHAVFVLHPKQIV